MSNSYDEGDLVRVSGAFTDENGDAADPTSVYCAVRDPLGKITIYAYGVDDVLVKDDTGNYHLDVSADLVGRYYYRWYSTGTGQAADETYFDVEESEFDG